MPGGDLHWIWKPYEIYVKIDKIYGFEALETKNGFTNAQSMLNVIESALNYLYVYLGTKHTMAPFIGYSAALMTLSKTLLYWLQEYYCDYCSAGHNSFADLLQYWIIPNGLWVVFPAYIVYVLGSDVVKSIRVAEQARKAKTTKAQ
ncbi:hypothetical protein FRB99_008591 [Tulasnella sp. 403]|nr:hypothetical protein FRB99_008591 [Tulasnella sp. 403]